MRRIRLDIEYDGTHFCGWQRQREGLRTVQQTLEDALFTLTGQRTLVEGASRTDAGVHARGQVAHFDTSACIPDDKFVFALNTKLPKDVRITSSMRAPDSFHARFSSRGKIYAYQIFNRRHAPAIERLTHAHVYLPLDLDAMKRALPPLLGRHDFSAFAASGNETTTSTRTLYRISLTQQEETITLRVWGGGFLYHMVRIIAGTLIDIGLGRAEESVFAKALETKNRLDLGNTAPSCGLTLLHVFFGEEGEREGPRYFREI